MGYLEMANRYIQLSKMIGYLEKQKKDGDNDLSTTQKIEGLRREQRELAEKLDDYNMKYNKKTWRCD